MNACCTLAPVAVQAASPLDRPMVLIDGVMEPGVIVERLDLFGPLDTRRAVLRNVNADLGAGQWLVVQPVRLAGDRLRLRVLTVCTQPRRVGPDRVELMDDWTAFLRKSVAVLGLDRAGQPLLRVGGALASTRSAHRYRIHDRDVHVLVPDGEPWTTADALASIAAFAGISLNLRGLPPRIAQAPLVSPIDLVAPLERVLTQVFAPYGLCLSREGWLEGPTLVHRLSVRPYAHGRRMRLRWTRPDQALGEVLRVHREKPLPGSRLWIAEAGGPTVESTFPLVGAWDPALEGESQETYDRAESSDFATYANVYRRWVLNEDGAYTSPPFDRGDPYDLATLFEQHAVAPTRLRFLPCVALDDAGRPRDPLVEYSTDSGDTWSQWPGRARLLDDHAGLHLDDATLPGPFLAAALAGEARVRITASLRSPVPVRVQRWRGNPFTGVRPARLIDLSHRFAFRRVHQASVHHAPVAEGSLHAGQRDDAAAMHGWLLDRMWRDGLALDAREGEATLTLLDAAEARPGDQLLEAGSRGRDLDHQAQALRRDGGIVTSVSIDFDKPATTVALRY